MNRFLKIGGVFAPLGLQAPVDAILSPTSAWATNVQGFYISTGTNYLNLSGKNLTGITPAAVANWIGANNQMNGNAGTAAVDLSGANFLDSAQIDALCAYLVNSIGYGFASLNISGGANAAPTPAQLQVNGIGAVQGGNGTPLGTTGTIYLTSFDGNITIANYSWIETDTSDIVQAALNVSFGNPISDPAIGNPVLAGADTLGLTVAMSQPFIPYAANAAVLALVAGGVTVTTN